MTTVIPAKAKFHALNGSRALRPSSVESPSAMINSYLWMADPRQVPFLCSCKEKEPKESTPRSRRLPLALLARAGAAQLARRKQRAFAQTGARLTTPARAVMLGGGYGCLKTPQCEGQRCFALTPSERAEHRARPGVFARLLIEPEARCSAPGELGERPAEARRAGERPLFGRRSDRVSFSLVTFSWISKRKSPGVQRRSHPQLAFERPRSGLDRN